MVANNVDTSTDSVDPDDAPELTEDFFQNGVWQIGERKVSRKEGTAALRAALLDHSSGTAHMQQALTVHYDTDIIAAFQAQGPDWQARMNAALRDGLETHPQP